VGSEGRLREPLDKAGQPACPMTHLACSWSMYVINLVLAVELIVGLCQLKTNHIRHHLFDFYVWQPDETNFF
jgi:hypothetical protein